MMSIIGDFLSCIKNYAVHRPNHFPFGVYSLPDTTAEYSADSGVILWDRNLELPFINPEYYVCMASL